MLETFNKTGPPIVKPMQTAAGQESRHAQVTDGERSRILMLVHHEPSLDPRISWVAGLCAEAGPTDVIGFVRLYGPPSPSPKPEREQDGNICIERINIYRYASPAARALSRLIDFLCPPGAISRFTKREEQWTGDSRPARSFLANIDHQIGRVCRRASYWAVQRMIASALYRRARAVEEPPAMIVCHDLFALAAAVELKKVFGSPILYDTHEFWPEADLLAQKWEQRLIARTEQQLIRHADVVVTVSPQLARHLERCYGIRGVLSAPNAEPRARGTSRAQPAPPGLPVRFLFQGQVDPHRGVEELLRGWGRLEPDAAVLYLRCPPNEYLTHLCRKFSELIEAKRVIVLDPVSEEELVPAAGFADVGIIPYAGPNVNHLFCCPNKLSQYMQAGLAILSNRLEFVSEVIRRYECGLVYESADPDSLIRAVRSLAGQPAVLHAMKQKARTAAQSEFNWDVQAAGYRDAIRRLYQAGCRALSRQPHARS